MKNRILISSLISMMLLACGAPQNQMKQIGQKDDNSISREHCLSQNNNASCFLEIEANGKSSFYAPERDYQDLMTNPVLADMNIPIKQLDTKAYADMVNKYEPATLVYDQSSASKVEAYANTGKADSPALNGWWDSWGRKAVSILGKAIGGGLTGAAAGAAIGTAVPVIGNVIGAIGGGIIGAIGGGLAGAVSNSKGNLVYHYGEETSTTEVMMQAGE